jgi:hypothetical protein
MRACKTKFYHFGNIGPRDMPSYDDMVIGIFGDGGRVTDYIYRLALRVQPVGARAWRHLIQRGEFV